MLNFSLFRRIPKNHFIDLEYIDSDNLTWRRSLGTLLPSIEAENTIHRKKNLCAHLFKERSEVIFSSDLTYVHLKADSMPFC